MAMRASDAVATVSRILTSQHGVPTMPCRIVSRNLLLAVGIGLSATTQASAAARPDTRIMTCEQARAFVREKGAVIMSTGQYTYERFVSGYGYCDRGEETWLQVAPTKDNPKCRVGYICRDRISDDHEHGPIWRMR
jgi:hypothetical protein